VYKPPITRADDAGDDNSSSPPTAHDLAGTTCTAAPADSTAPIGSSRADRPGEGTSADGSETTAGAASTSVPNAGDGVIAAKALVADISRRVGGIARHDARGYQDEQDAASAIFITEVLKTGDPRASTPEMEVAKWAEVDGLKRRRA